MGGSERQLVYLANGLAYRGHDIMIVTMYSIEAFGGFAMSSRIRVRSIKKRDRWNLLSPFFRLFQLVQNEKPDILHGYGAIPNLVLTITKIFPRSPLLVYGVRSAYMNYKDYDWTAKLAADLEVRFSGLADVIIANSSAGLNYARRRGMSLSKLRLVENGLDCGCFRPNFKSREWARLELGIGEHETLVGFVGRNDPVKDLPNFIEGVSAAMRTSQHLKALVVGGVSEDVLHGLEELINSKNLSNRVYWRAPTKDIVTWLSGMDIFVSSSYGESSSNAILEAMACGLPCVVTDVGESARVVSDFGEVVPSKNSSALAEGIKRLADLSPDARRTMGHRGRQSVCSRFGVDILTDRSEELLADLVCRKL